MSMPKMTKSVAAKRLLECSDKIWKVCALPTERLSEGDYKKLISIHRELMKIRSRILK